MNTQTVYQTTPAGLYQYETVANELKFTPGVFNIPFGAVETAPPAPASGMVPRWTGSAWEQVEDHRGEDLYVVESGERYTLGKEVEVSGSPVSYPGWGPLPAWLMTTAPVPAE